MLKIYSVYFMIGADQEVEEGWYLNGKSLTSHPVLLSQ
jgi:hypothetical protein